MSGINDYICNLCMYRNLVDIAAELSPCLDHQDSVFPTTTLPFLSLLIMHTQQTLIIWKIVYKKISLL